MDKNNKKGIKDYLCVYKELLVYFLANVLFIIPSFAVSFRLSDEHSAALHSAISTEAVEIVTPIALAIITIIITIELVARQFFFKRTSKRYFYHTARNVCAVVMFFAVTILLVFDFGNRFTDALLLLSPFMIVIEMVCFICDIVHFDASRVIKKLYDDIIDEINALKIPRELLDKLNKLLMDFLENGEYVYADRIIGYIPSFFNKFLDKKHEADSTNPTPIHDVFQPLYGFFVTVVNSTDDTHYEKKIKQITLVLSKMLDQVIKYDCKDVTDEFANVVSSFAKLISADKERWSFFLDASLSKNEKDKNCIYKKVLWFDEFYEKYGPYNDFTCEPFAKRLMLLIDNKLIDVDSSVVDVVFRLAPQAILEGESGEMFSFFLLINVWKNIGDDLTETFINNLSTKADCFKYFKRMNKFETVATIHQVLDYCLQHNRNIEKVLIRDTQLFNIRQYMHYLKDSSAFRLFELSDDDLTANSDECRMLFSTLARIGNRNDIYYGILCLNERAGKLKEKDEEEIKIILGIFKACITEIRNNSFETDKVDALTERYYGFLISLDSKCSISDDLADFIIDDYFDTLDTLVSSDTKNAQSFSRILYRIQPFECKLRFINGRRKTKLLKCLCDKTFNIAISSIEDQKDDVIENCSNYLGWSAFYFLEENNPSYRNVIEKNAIPLFRALISLRYSQSTIYFVSTMFVVLLSYGLSQNNTDVRYHYSSSVLDGFSFKELSIIKDSIILRKNGAGLEKFIPNYDAAINHFEDEVTKRLEIMNNPKGKNKK